jgi:DNA-binding XRE family transcriptional regulator
MRQNLKEARQKAGMTQKQVAEYLGITLRAYQQIEAGEYQGKIEHWDKLEDLFGIHQRKLRELFPVADKKIDSNTK